MASSILILCLLLTVNFVYVQGLACPDKEVIAPCSCAFHPDYQSVQCTAANVTQADVNRIFSSLNAINSPLYLKEFSIGFSQLTSLDLTPFIGASIDILYLHYNSGLRKIHGPVSSGNGSVQDFIGSINVTSLQMDRNDLGDEGLQDFFHYFGPHLKILRIPYNRIEGARVGLLDGSGDVEFLPGFSTLVNLEHARFFSNSIKSVGGGQFKRNRNLVLVELGPNQIREVGEDAFVMDPPDGQNPNGTAIFLSLYYNPINDEGLHINSGLNRTNRAVTLELDDTSFSFLSEEKFLPFFETNALNSLLARRGHFHCDNRMKWLKDRKDALQSRVDGLECDNDKGNTVFTTDLID